MVKMVKMVKMVTTVTRRPATVQCTGGFCVFVILTFVGAWRADAAHFAQIFADLSRVFAVFRVRGERGGESEDRIEIINNKISCSLLP